MHFISLGLLLNAYLAFVSSTPMARKSTLNQNATWHKADYRELKLCPDNQIVVGMCSSGFWKSCGLNGDNTRWAQKVKCLKVDENKYVSTKESTTKTEMLTESKAFFWHKVLTCKDPNMFIGGFCTSGGQRDCGEKRKHYNEVVCRSGYQVEDGDGVKKRETKDVCGRFGEHIECEEGWAAIGMCSGLGLQHDYCPGLRCFADRMVNSMIGVNTIYGLRCAKRGTQGLKSVGSTTQ